MSADKLAQDLQLDAAHWKKLGDQAERDGERVAADAYRVCADQLCEALAAHQAQQAEQPAGYVTAIEEGKALMLPRASLDLTKLVPLYAGRADAQPVEPLFHAMSPEQERLAMKFCAEIAGPKGGRGMPPDPVRLLEMAEALYKADAAMLAARAEKGGAL